MGVFLSVIVGFVIGVVVTVVALVVVEDLHNKKESARKWWE